MAQQAKPNIYSHIDFPDYVFVEFPKALYRKVGDRVDSMAVANADEEATALADGWVTTPNGVAPAAPKAPAGKPPAAPDKV